MVATILLLLFIGQVLCFYFIILLYMKISKLKDVEKSQARLKDEMYNAVGAYLAETRDENDRLIKELTSINKKALKEESDSIPSKKENEKDKHLSTFQEDLTKPTFNTPRNIVAKAYQKSPTARMAATTITENDSTEKNIVKSKHSKETLTLKEQVQELYGNGKNIEEIAKLLQKGKTEIELLLKFQH